MTQENPYISVQDAQAILWQPIEEKYLVYASDALDALLDRFHGRLRSHEEMVIIDLKSWIRTYRPKITPIIQILWQELIDENWEVIWDYPFKIRTYDWYIRLQTPVKFRDKYQFLRLYTESWYFDECEVPEIIRQFVAKVWAKLQNEAANAWKVISWEVIASWSQSGFHIGNFSVDFTQDENWSSTIKSWESNSWITIWGKWELDMILARYWKQPLWFIY